MEWNASCGGTQIPFSGATYPCQYAPALWSSVYCEAANGTMENTVPVRYHAVYPTTESIMFATAYVWVETRFSRCMPTTGEVPAVYVNFFKTGTDPHYTLACLQGTPIHLANALNLYTARIEHALTNAVAYHPDLCMSSSFSNSESQLHSRPRSTLETTKHYIETKRDKPKVEGELKVYLDPSITVGNSDSGRAKSRSSQGGNRKAHAQAFADNQLKMTQSSDTPIRNSQSIFGNESSQKKSKYYRCHGFQHLNQSLSSPPRTSTRRTLTSLTSIPSDVIQDRTRQRPPSISQSSTAANFNILVNRVTFLLLTSYNGVPFAMLSWLTRAKFTVDEYDEQMKVCISGSRRDVDLGAKVLKEVMIFIGNRFTHWFSSNGNVKDGNPDSLPTSPVTPTQEQGRCSRNRAMEISTEPKHVTIDVGNSDNIKNDKIEIGANASDADETVGQEREVGKGKVKQSVAAQAKKKKNVQRKMLDNAILNGKGKQGTAGTESPTLQIILVDESETGKIIGYKGENIGRIEKDSGAFVQMTKINIVHMKRRVRAIFFVGPLDSVMRARRTVMETVRFCMLYETENQEN